jgi:hypothetical protein
MWENGAGSALKVFHISTRTLLHSQNSLFFLEEGIGKWVLEIKEG